MTCGTECSCYLLVEMSQRHAHFRLTEHVALCDILSLLYIVTLLLTDAAEIKFSCGNTPLMIEKNVIRMDDIYIKKRSVKY
jgi:hypothetical protein